MWEFSTRLRDSPHSVLSDDGLNFYSGGIFLDSSSIPHSIVNNTVGEAFRCGYGRPVRKGGGFLCLSLSVKGKDSRIGSSAESVGGGAVAAKAVDTRFRGRGQGAMNATKHLCAGAVAAMVSRSVF